MKTIKLVVLALVLATLSSCSKDSNIITGGDIVPPPPPPEIYKYDLEEYYEPTVKINKTSYVGGDRMYVGRESFTDKYTNYETLDTLIIDGKNQYNLKEIRFFGTYDNPPAITSAYREIKYLKIINLENDNVKIVFDDIYGKIKIGGSNLSLSELNANSYSISGVWRKADAFEIVDMTKETASFLGGNDISTLYTNFLGKEVGYVDYANGKREGKKYKLIAKTKKSTYGR